MDLNLKLQPWPPSCLQTIVSQYLLGSPTQKLANSQSWNCFLNCFPSLTAPAPRPCSSFAPAKRYWAHCLVELHRSGRDHGRKARAPACLSPLSDDIHLVDLLNPPFLHTPNLQSNQLAAKPNGICLLNISWTNILPFLSHCHDQVQVFPLFLDCACGY